MFLSDSHETSKIEDNESIETHFFGFRSRDLWLKVAVFGNLSIP